MRRSRSHYLFWGLMLILLGVLFFLHNTHYLDFRELMRKYWPLLIVLIGLKMLWERRDSSGDHHTSFTIISTPSAGQSDTSSGRGQTATRNTYSNIFGDIRLSFENQNIDRFSVNTVFGDIKLDFSKSTFEPEAKIKVNAVFGDITIWIPDNARLRANVNFLAGSSRFLDQEESGIFKNITYQSPAARANGPAGRIDVSVLFGDIQILP